MLSYPDGASKNLQTRKYQKGFNYNPDYSNICDEPEIRELLDSYGIPEGHIVWATVALGYSKEKGKKLAKKKEVIQYID